MYGAVWQGEARHGWNYSCFLWLGMAMPGDVRWCEVGSGMVRQGMVG
jgi:hypothetical protein